MSNKKHHAQWIPLLEPSGPFLSIPVLEKVFPQGLDAHDPEHVRSLRLAFEEWEDNQLSRRPDPAIHNAWVQFVLKETLGLPGETLASGQSIPQTVKATISEHGEVLRPDYVVRNPEGVPDAGKPRMLVQVYPLEQDLEKHVYGQRWKASPADRMAELLKQTKCQLGLVTNGQHWLLTNKTDELPTGFASWYSNLWLEESITLRAFRSLLSVNRFFGAQPGQTLEEMLAESATHQQEVTDQLGLQVRNAVEILIQSLDRADQDHGRELLGDIPETVLYESALTVMMRLVFLFCAEERELLLLGDPLYDQHYALSTLVAQLQETADNHGEEILAYRKDAWSRLIATFRAVYGGVGHERMKLPAYAGNLFDPDRFPFLEGRKPGTTWKDTPANPLPVNNRTVLHLLRSLQYLQTHREAAQRISFRALGIEQIGHVYEGLLDHTAKRATEPVLGLVGKKEPEIPLAELEKLRDKGEDDLFKFLKEETGSSRDFSRLLDPELESDEANKLRAACGNDEELYRRVRRFAGLVRIDTFGRPVVIRKGSVYVTSGTDRRTSGTHYTPTTLTEPIVKHTLDPLCYVGPAEGKPEAEWKLRPAKELLELKVCDMACGSGAFLVQACRYLAELLVEAWEEAEQRVAGGEWREGEGDACTELSRTQGVAGCDDAGREVLRGDEAVSQRGDVRSDQPDSTGSGLNPGQSGGGTGAAIDEGVSQLHQHRQRIADGSGNPSGTEPPSGAAAETKARRTSQLDRRDQPDAHRTAKQPSAADLTSLATRYSPLITPFGDVATGSPGEQLIPLDTEERLTYARRLVAQRCLYGVDKNSLAVEMAKLSLWLLTLAKDKPFTFLDHAIRCGDSLVGISSIEQLLRFSLDERVTTGPLLEQQRQQIENRLNAVKLLRKQIEEQPSNTPQDIERKALMLKNADEQTRRLTYAADLLLAESWQPMTAAEREAALNSTLIEVEYKFKDLPVEQLDAEAKKRLRKAGVESRFHWPLEFPEVFERGGFDAFVGNPPFVGGRRIRGTFGEPYLRWLTDTAFPGSSRNADLCAFFFRRAHELLLVNGGFGLLATNTISQGDTLSVGLLPLCTVDSQIPRAVSSRTWPGTASVFVSEVWLRRGRWNGIHVLDGAAVPQIAPTLTVGRAFAGTPYRLVANSGLSFQGSITLGMGFVLEPAEAQELIARNDRNRDVLFPYLNGEDLNSQPDQSPTRWVINFFDWPLTRLDAPADYSGPVAADYPECLRIIEERVKQERLSKSKDIAKAPWWRFWRVRKELYTTIAPLRRVLVRAQVSRTHAPVFLTTDVVFSMMTIVFALDSDAAFAALQSNLHEAWLDEYSSSLKNDRRYTPTDSFDTFPFPAEESLSECRMGAAYHEYRQRIMSERNEGLTATYNRFHDPDQTAADIQKLRDLHVEMDKAVAAAYGWDDLDLGHDFHETKQGVRFTISEAARREVLQRLLKLNHERYEEEVRQGLHDKKRGGKRVAGGGKKAGRAKRTSKQGPRLPGMDGEDEEGEPARRTTSHPTPATRTTRPPAPATHNPPPDTNAFMAAFRQAARNRGWLDREDILREVAGLLGYQRLGSRIKETLKGHMRAAIRRGILEPDGDSVRALTATMNDYTRDELRDTLCSVMRKGTTYDREDVIYAVAHHLGFSRITETVRTPIKSAINSAIRQGLLGYEGNAIWREA